MPEGSSCTPGWGVEGDVMGHGTKPIPSPLLHPRRRTPKSLGPSGKSSCSLGTRI